MKVVMVVVCSSQSADTDGKDDYAVAVAV